MRAKLIYIRKKRRLRAGTPSVVDNVDVELLNLPSNYAESVEDGIFGLEGENAVKNRRIVGQADVLLAGARRAGGVAVPIGNDPPPLGARRPEGGELLGWDEREVLRAVVGVGHGEMLNGEVGIVGRPEKVSAALVWQFGPRLGEKGLEGRTFDAHGGSFFVQVAHCLLVINEFGDGGVRAAHGAFVSLMDVDLAKVHGLGIECQELIGKQLAHACEIFEGLGSLDGAEHARYGSEDSGLRARGDETRRWRRVEDATVARVARRITLSRGS